MKLKHIWAWLLLLVISVQWIGGVIFVKLSHSALIERTMDEAEQLLARRMEAEYGIQAHVRILDAQAQRSIMAIGYGTPFIFSTEEAGHTAYFTIEQDSADLYDFEYVVYGSARHPDSGKSLLTLHKLFSPYIINAASLLRPAAAALQASGNFTYSSLRDLYCLRIPTPPPNPVG